MIPKEGDEICVVAGTIQYQIGNNTYQNEISNPDFDTENGEHTCWTPIPSFTIFGCGDLAFYATILGRENSSTCYCPYCSLTAAQWKKRPKLDSHEMTNELITQISHLDLKTNGVKCAPIWTEIPVKHYAVPLLHMEMGMVNLSLNQLVEFIDEKVEKVSD